jgi:ankyrin repeat protein
VKVLLEAGADINSCDHERLTPLIIAYERAVM